MLRRKVTELRRQEALLGLLADGRFHSGEQIATELGCTRSAIWKRMRELREIPGIEVDSVTGRGYRLCRPIELLDRNKILAAAANPEALGLQGCQVLGSVVSTNALAGEAELTRPGQGAAWFAEHQSAGRGRRGRTWVSPYGRNLYFSLAWQFDAPLSELAGLSIAAGAMLAGLLERHGLSGHGLKWPNDLLWDGKKLAGILLEVHGETGGPANAVLGIGVNIDLEQTLQDQIDQPATSLRGAGLGVGRNRLAGELLQASVEMCHQFAASGLQPFVAQWRGFDLFKDQPVCLTGPGLEHRGRCLGLDDDGGLRLQEDGVVRTFYAGELSLRGGDRA